MESYWTPYEQRDFRGGENLKIMSEFMADNQLVNGINCELTEEGIPQTRLGKTKINATSLGSGPIISAFRFAKEDGTKYIVVQHGLAVYSVVWDGVSPITSFGVPIINLTSTNILRGVVWKDNLIMTNGEDNPFRINGTSAAYLTGSPPKSKIIALYASKLWLVDVANPNHIRVSGLEDYNLWDALDVIKVRDGDGDIITGLRPEANSMGVFKSTSYQILFGFTRYEWRVSDPIDDIKGCISLDGFVPGVCLGVEGWFRYDVNSITELPDTHTPLLAELSTAIKTNIRAFTHRIKTRGFFILGPNSVVMMDGKRNTIFQWVGLNVNCMVSLDAKGDDGGLLIGDYSDGFLYRLDNSLDDDGAPINTTIVTGYNNQDSTRKKVWRYFEPFIKVLTGQGTYFLKTFFDIDYNRLSGYKANEGDASDLPLVWDSGNWDERVWSPVTDIKTKMWIHGARGDKISFKIQSDSRIEFRGYKTLFREVGPL